MISGRLFESPQPTAVSSPPRQEEIDEIISDEISLDGVDVIPIDTHTSPKEPSPKDLMHNILERIQTLEKMSTNQKMRKWVTTVLAQLTHVLTTGDREIELTLKQLRVLESKFAEYNKEHIQSILDDFSAGINAKLDQFLNEKQREVE